MPSRMLLRSYAATLATGDAPRVEALGGLLGLAGGTVTVDLGAVYAALGGNPADAAVDRSLDRRYWTRLRDVTVDSGAGLLTDGGYVDARRNHYRVTARVGDLVVAVFTASILPGASRAEFATYTDGSGYVQVDLSRLPAVIGGET